jgi:hypothetical protein
MAEPEALVALWVTEDLEGLEELEERDPMVSPE